MSRILLPVVGGTSTSRHVRRKSAGISRAHSSRRVRHSLSLLTSLMSFMKFAGILRPSLWLMILCSQSHCSSQKDTYSVLIRFGKSILVAVLLMFRAELLLQGAVQATLSLNINNLARLIRLPCVF